MEVESLIKKWGIKVPGTGVNLEGQKDSKRIRDSPSKNPKAKKQTTISKYWLAKDDQNH